MLLYCLSESEKAWVSLSGLINMKSSSDFIQRYIRLLVLFSRESRAYFAFYPTLSLGLSAPI